MDKGLKNYYIMLAFSLIFSFVMSIFLGLIGVIIVMATWILVPLWIKFDPNNPIFKKVGGLFGEQGKAKWKCRVCGGMRFLNDGSCYVCGSKTKGFIE